MHAPLKKLEPVSHDERFYCYKLKLLILYCCHVCCCVVLLCRWTDAVGVFHCLRACAQQAWLSRGYVTELVLSGIVYMAHGSPCWQPLCCNDSVHGVKRSLIIESTVQWSKSKCMCGAKDCGPCLGTFTSSKVGQSNREKQILSQKRVKTCKLNQTQGCADYWYAIVTTVELLEITVERLKSRQCQMMWIRPCRQCVFGGILVHYSSTAFSKAIFCHSS